MKNIKSIAVILAVIVVVAGIILVVKSAGSKKAAAKPQAAVQKPAKSKTKAAPAKKRLSKDMGGLTVRLLNSNGKEVYSRMKAFKVSDANSSLYVTAMTSNRMQELAPGIYDIEMETIPQKIYKNIRVLGNKEVVADLGCPTGSIMIKALNSKKKNASYLARILYPKSNVMVTAATTNRPLELIPGVYDIEVETLPRQVKKGVKISAGKETVIDLGGASGCLIVKAIDPSGKDVRSIARIRDAANNDIITSTSTNRPIEIQQGTYNIEIASNPPQVKKDVKVVSGEEAVVEFSIQPAAQKAPAASRRNKK